MTQIVPQSTTDDLVRPSGNPTWSYTIRRDDQNNAGQKVTVWGSVFDKNRDKNPEYIKETHLVNGKQTLYQELFDEDSNGVKECVVKYDDIGNLASETYFDNTSGAATRQIQYRPDGQKLSDSTFDPTTGHNVSTEYYDSFGCLSSKVEYNPQTGAHEKTTKYDYQGNITETYQTVDYGNGVKGWVRTNAQGQQEGYSYTFDADGKVASQRAFNYDGSYQETFYDAAGNTTGTTTYIRQNLEDGTRRDCYKYSDGTVKFEYFDAQGGYTGSKTQNANNQVTQTERRYTAEDGSHMAEINDYTYNADGTVSVSAHKVNLDLPQQ